MASTPSFQAEAATRTVITNAYNWNQIGPQSDAACPLLASTCLNWHLPQDCWQCGEPGDIIFSPGKPNRVQLGNLQNCLFHRYRALQITARTESCCLCFLTWHTPTHTHSHTFISHIYPQKLYRRKWQTIYKGACLTIEHSFYLHSKHQSIMVLS